MIEDTVGQVFNSGIYRFLADGVDYRDLEDIRAAVREWSEWGAGWTAAAAKHVELAEGALARRRTLTAGEALWRASLYCHYGQGPLYFDPEQKRTIQREKEKLFERAATLLDPPLERLEIPFERTSLPAYLRLPRGARPFPCAILLGGLDTTKEDYFQFNELCTRRGLATLAFDGPGQGEMFYRMKWRPDFEKAVFAVIDYLERRREIDPSRIGIIGRSTGGHYVCKVAALDQRVKVAVVWGAMYSLRNLPTTPPIIREGFIFASGSSTVEEATKFYECINLEGIVSGVKCPLLVVHGGRDVITPPENAELTVRYAGGPTELLFYEESIHCCHDRAHIVRPAMADFLAEHLVG